MLKILNLNIPHIIRIIIISILVLFKNNFLLAQTEFNIYDQELLNSHLAFLNKQYSNELLYQLNNYDVKFYKLDLSVSKSSTEIYGNGTIYAEIQNSPIDTFVVELIDSLAENTYMVVDSVIVNGQLLDFTHANQLIKIVIDPQLPVGSYINAVIYYHGNGQASVLTGYNGISNGTIFNLSVTYTYSEPFWSRVWWPCKQVLGDKADSLQISLTIDSDCKAGSNGVLESVTPLPGGKVKYYWKSNYPIAYYLVSFAAGQYIENLSYAFIEGITDSILIQSFLFQDCPYLPMHLNAINKTKQNLQLFTNLFGNYPFINEKYGYCLTSSQWGAMENQTMTTTGYRALDTTAAYVSNYYYFWYSAHELGHSWFGDNVTCATWQDIWVNEGFASYSEYLALQNLESQERADFWMSDAHQKTLLEPGGSVFVPDEFKYDENRIFDYRLSKKKGAAILHMIRFEVGNDSLFFLSLKNFQNEFRFNVATGLDFKEILETTTGQDFTDFFDQWYYGEGYPIYNISWIQEEDTIRIHSVQSTSTSETPLFNMHLELKLQYSNGDTLIRINQNSNNQFYQIYSPHLITNIVVDPNNWVLDYSTVIHTGIKNDEINRQSYKLYQNYPNPFNPTTKISYQIPKRGFVTLKVYDVLGNEIITLFNEEKPAGNYEFNFDGTQLTSGIYFYQLVAKNFLETKKMILLK